MFDLHVSYTMYKAATAQDRLGGATLCPRPGVVAGRSHLAPKAKGGGPEEPSHARGQGSDQEEQPNVQGVVAPWAQEGLEEPSHVEGQERRW